MCTIKASEVTQGQRLLVGSNSEPHTVEKVESQEHLCIISMKDDREKITKMVFPNGHLVKLEEKSSL